MDQREIEKVPFWRKLLHWPIVGGRDAMWAASSAIAIPYMTSHGLSESTAMGVYAAAGVWSIANDLIAGWLSENCTSPIGRRRPFIIYYTLAVGVSLSVLYMSELFVEDLLLAQIILFIGFTIIDSSLWTLEAPKTSYLLEVFNESDQRQIMNGNVFWSGLGGCLGCFITSQFGISYGLLPVYIMGCLFILTSILNVLSVPELSLKELREANLVEQEDMKMGETICAIIRIPMPLLKLGLAGFIAMYLNIIPYIWFTHQYAEVVFRADKEYLRSLNETDIQGQNGTSFDKLKPLLEEEMALSYEEQLSIQFHWLYELGIEQGAKVMIAFPLLQMSICLVMETTKIDRLVGSRILYSSAFLLFGTCTLIMWFYDHWLLFLFETFCLGFFVFIFCTVPFKILNELRKTKDYPKDRGLSVDCSFMTALICLGQLVSSAIVGILIEYYGSSRIINPYISIVAAVGFLHCWFIVDYPELNPKSEGESSESEGLTNRKEETFSSIVRD